MIPETSCFGMGVVDKVWYYREGLGVGVGVGVEVLDNINFSRVEIGVRVSIG